MNGEVGTNKIVKFLNNVTQEFMGVNETFSPKKKGEGIIFPRKGVLSALAKKMKNFYVIFNISHNFLSNFLKLKKNLEFQHILDFFFFFLRMLGDS